MHSVWAYTDACCGLFSTQAASPKKSPSDSTATVTSVGGFSTTSRHRPRSMKKMVSPGSPW